MLGVKQDGSEFNRSGEKIYLRINLGIYSDNNGESFYADNGIIRFVFLKYQFGCSVVDRVKSYGQDWMEAEQ